jgi:hypothetical protein
MFFHADEVHVLPHERSGGWLVEAEDTRPAPPWFGTAGEAQRAAHRHAQALGARCVVIHDRYHRVHAISTHAPGLVAHL